MITADCLITLLIVVLIPGTGMIYTELNGISGGRRGVYGGPWPRVWLWRD